VICVCAFVLSYKVENAMYAWRNIHSLLSYAKLNIFSLFSSNLTMWLQSLLKLVFRLLYGYDKSCYSFKGNCFSLFSSPSHHIHASKYSGYSTKVLKTSTSLREKDKYAKDACTFLSLMLLKLRSSWSTLCWISSIEQDPRHCPDSFLM